LKKEKKRIIGDKKEKKSKYKLMLFNRLAPGFRRVVFDPERWIFSRLKAGFQVHSFTLNILGKPAEAGCHSVLLAY